MTLFLKRYLAPVFVAIALYSLIYALLGEGVPFFNAGLPVCVLFALSIRIVDDLKDYERDKTENKVLFKKRTLYYALGFLTGLTIGICVYFSIYLLLLPFVLLIPVLFFPEKFANWIKPILLPAMVIALAFTIFEFQFLIVLIALLCAIIDIFLINDRRK